MSWWQYQNQQAARAREAAQYQAQMQAQMARWQAQQQLTLQKKDSGGILGWMGDKAGDAIGGVGDLITDSVTKGMEGLQWYDDNVVKNVWNNGTGRVIAEFTGQEFDENWRYENLDGWAKFGAGIVGDPLTYLPGAAVATKGLKVATMAGNAQRGANSIRLARGLDAVVGGANTVSNLPFELAMKGAKYGIAKPIGLGAQGLARGIEQTDLGTEFFRAISRPTATFEATRNQMRTRGYLGNLLTTSNPDMLPETMSVNTLRSTLNDNMVKVQNYNAEKLRLQKLGLDTSGQAAPTDIEQRTYRLLTGGTPTTNRIYEQFRRIASPTAKNSIRKATPDLLTTFDNVIARNLDQELTDSETIVQLANAAGADDLATRLIAGSPEDFLNDPTYKGLTEWLASRKAAPSDLLKDLDNQVHQMMKAPEYAKLSPAQVGIEYIAKRNYDNTMREINEGTQLTRQFMGNIGEWADFGDKYHQKYWTNGIDKYLVKPFTTMVLGFPFFPVGNVMEEASMSLIGGKRVTSPWIVGADEMLNFWQQLPPEFQLPQSLLEGLTPESAMDNLFVLRGSEGIKLPDRGLKGLVTGGLVMRQSNKITANLRRAYFTDAFDRNVARLLDDVLPTDKKLWEGLTPTQTKSVKFHARMAVATGDVSYLNRARMSFEGPEALRKRLSSIMADTNLDEETRQFLENNAATFLSGDQKVYDEVLKQAYERRMTHVTLSHELSSENAVEFMEEMVGKLGASEDLDELFGAITSYDDMMNGIDGLFKASAHFGSKVGSKSGRVAEHEFNRAQQLKHEALQRRGVEAGHKATKEALDRLERHGLITAEGKKAVTAYRRAVDEKYSLYRKRAVENLALDKKFDMGSKQWYDARIELNERYDRQLEPVRIELDKHRSEFAKWVPAGSPSAATAQAPVSVGDAGLAPTAAPSVPTAADAGTPATSLSTTGLTPSSGEVKGASAAAPPSGPRRDPAIDALTGRTSRDDRKALLKTAEGAEKENWAATKLKEAEEKFDAELGAAAQSHPNVLVVLEFDKDFPRENLDYLRQWVKSRKSSLGNISNVRFGVLPGSEWSAPMKARLEKEGLYATSSEGHRIRFKFDKDLSDTVSQASRLSATDRKGSALALRAEASKTLDPNAGDLRADMETAAKSGAVSSRPASSEDLARFAEPRNPDVLAQQVFPDDALELPRAEARPGYAGSPTAGTFYSEADQAAYAREVGDALEDELWRMNPDEVNSKLDELYNNYVDTYLDEIQTTEGPKTVRVALTDEEREIHLRVLREKLRDPYFRTQIRRGEGSLSEIEAPFRDTMADIKRAQLLRPDEGPSAAMGPKSPNIRPHPGAERKLEAQLLADAAEVARLEPVPPTPAIRAIIDRLPPEAIQEIRDGVSSPEILIRAGIPSEKADDLYFALEEAVDYMDNNEKLAEIVRIEDHLKARAIAQEQSLPPAQAQEMVAEMNATDDLLDTPEMREKVKRWSTLFKHSRIEDIPMEKLGPIYKQAEDEWYNMVRAIEHSRSVPLIDPQTGGRIDELFRATGENIQKRGVEDLRAKGKQAWDDATRDYHRWFTNYDSGSSVHQFMRHIFPFWRYELQRYPRIAKTALKHPFLATSYHRFMTQSEDGNVRIPGTSMRFNPTGGMMFNSVRTLMQNGGYAFNKNGNNWEQFSSLMQRTGFIPGPQVGIPLAAKGGAIGDAMPTTPDLALNAASGYGSQLPGGIGEPLAQTAEGIQNLLPSRWRRYNTDIELIDKGIHPFKATPEQDLEARRAAARSGVIGEGSGQMFDSASEAAVEMRKERVAAAISAGVPEDQAEEAARFRRNPLFEVNKQGVPYLNVAERRALTSAHPEWEQLAAANSSFTGPAERARAGEKFKDYDQREAFNKQIEDQLLPAYEAFQRGDIDGATFRELRDDAMTQMRAVREFLNQRHPYEQTGEPLPEAREDTLAGMYYAIQPTPAADGTLDFKSVEAKRSALLRMYEATPEEISYITETYPRQRWTQPLMNAVEEEYKGAQDLMGQYQDLPQFPGLSPDQEAKALQGLELLDRIKSQRPNLTTTQALAILARTNPGVAQITRRALTIRSSSRRKGAAPTPRKQFWDSNPVLSKYYGS